MEKMKMESADLTKQNIEKIGLLFPNCITESKDEDGNLKKAINFDLLKQMLSSDIVEGDEAYEFTWVGKKASIIEANKPIRKTLRPCKEESVNWDTTENLYIEGDNLEVLKLLQESYLNSINIIFIDPPYNTGSDRFVYPDNYRMSIDEYREEAGIIDENEEMLFLENSSTNPRFHSLWCSMLHSRLLLARNLLTEDGIIFITLDDKENYNCRKICNEVFGESNFITEFIWEKKKKPSFLHRNVGKLFDYVLCYAKRADKTKPFSVEKTTKDKKYPLNNAGNSRRVIVFPPMTVRFADKNAVYKPQDMSEGNIYTVLKNKVIVNNHLNKNEIILEGEWRYSQDKINEIIADGGEFSISKIPFRPNHIKGGDTIKKMKNILSLVHYKCETNEDGTEQIENLFGFDVFDTPKPIGLIKLLINATTYDKKDAVIMDFFSGSATTAHATLYANLDDDGKRKFIMVQLPELYNEKSEAYKRGYRTISDTGKERIKLAGKDILENNKESKVDVGFRVLKVDDSNMNDIYYYPEEYDQKMLSKLGYNVKSDRSEMDILFSCLLEWGLPLSLPYNSEKIDGCTIHNYNNGDLIACFDKNIPDSVFKEIARRQPLRAVFIDSSFAEIPTKINVGEIFKLLAPDTRIKVI
nr:MAG TPA: adenine-specific methyltransferase [Caudoviricetes sp.]